MDPADRLAVETPDYVEPFIGWRVWLVAEDGDLIRLRSVVFNVPWRVREPIVADCLRRRINLLPWRQQAAHPAPTAQCDCGIYGATLHPVRGLPGGPVRRA